MDIADRARSSHCNPFVFWDAWPAQLPKTPAFTDARWQQERTDDELLTTILNGKGTETSALDLAPLASSLLGPSSTAIA